MGGEEVRMGKGEDDVRGRLRGVLRGNKEAVDGSSHWDCLDTWLHVCSASSNAFRSRNAIGNERELKLANESLVKWDGTDTFTHRK